MSIIFGILLLLATGRAILFRLKVSLPIVETTAYSLLTGIGLQSVWMFLCDVFQIQFSQPLLSVFNLALVVLLTDFDELKKFNFQKLINDKTVEWKAAINAPDLGSLTLLTVISGLFYLIAAKGLYWPTSEHDAIGTFDKLGMWFALEGKIHVSLYDVGLQGAGGIYPPLFPSSIAYCYLYEGDNPKLMSLLFYVLTLALMFASLRKYISDYGALFFTLILAWAPEFFSHAGLLLSNVPSAAYITASSLSLFLWWREKQTHYFTLACLMIGFSMWLRQDLIPFAAAGLIVVMFDLKAKGWKKIGLYVIAVAAPIVAWSLYAKFSLRLSTAERFGEGSFITVAKLQVMASYLWAYFGAGQQGSSPPGYFLYGLAFLLPLTFAIANFKNLRNDFPVVPFYFLFSLILYVLIFLLIDEKLQKASLQSLLESSFKRGLFCFMPIALFYAGVSTFSKKIFSAIEGYRTGKEKVQTE